VRTIITKGEYARLKERSPAAVSIWIRDGKISRDALIGEGNAAKIWVEQADADLARSLDPAQQAAQAHPVGLVPVPAPIAAPPAARARRTIWWQSNSITIAICLAVGTLIAWAAPFRSRMRKPASA
jgi:hypothetical protein